MSKPHPSPSFRETPPPPIFLESAEVALAQLRRDRDRTTGVVRKMLDYLEQVLFEPSLSVEAWKRACDIRDNSVAIRFHRTLGLPPRTYVERLRIEAGSRLLRESSLVIWQIAELLGFSNLGIFSKAFVRCVGIRPREYRRRAQAGDDPPFAISNLELEKAVVGDLEEKQAGRLIVAILSRYPGLALPPISGLGDSEDGDSEDDDSKDDGLAETTSP